MSTERFNIVFKNYPEHVQLSKERAKKYIAKGKSLNKTQQKLLESGRYIWKERGIGGAKGLYLYDTKTDHPELHLSIGDSGEFVVKNSKAAGTPNIKKINGQIFWEAGANNIWLRQAIKDFLRTWFVPAIARQLPEKIFTSAPDTFIQFEYIFYMPFDTTLMTQYQDYLNLGYVYAKVFEDILVEMEIIKDDNPMFLRGGYIRYVQIPKGEERRLEVKVHFCKNNERIS